MKLETQEENKPSSYPQVFHLSTDRTSETSWHTTSRPTCQRHTFKRHSSIPTREIRYQTKALVEINRGKKRMAVVCLTRNNGEVEMGKNASTRHAWLRKTGGGMRGWHMVQARQNGGSGEKHMLRSSWSQTPAPVRGVNAALLPAKQPETWEDQEDTRRTRRTPGASLIAPHHQHWIQQGCRGQTQYQTDHLFLTLVQ